MIKLISVSGFPLLEDVIYLYKKTRDKYRHKLLKELLNLALKTNVRNYIMSDISQYGYLLNDSSISRYSEFQVCETFVTVSGS